MYGDIRQNLYLIQLLLPDDYLATSLSLTAAAIAASANANARKAVPAQQNQPQAQVTDQRIIPKLLG